MNRRNDPYSRDCLEDDDGIYDRRGRTRDHVELVRGWSTTGRLITRNADNPSPSSFVGLQVDFQNKHTEYYTVQFSISGPIEPIDPGVDDISIRGVAEIIWTVAGNNIRRLVTVTNGMSISGLGRAVFVRVSDDSINTSGVRFKEYDVGILIAPGTRPTFGASQPPIYMPRDILVVDVLPVPPPYTIPTGATANIPVPENAGVNSVYLALRPGANTLNLRNVLIEFLGPSGPISVTDGDICNRFVPVPPGTTIIAVSNADPDFIEITQIFGIEG